MKKYSVNEVAKMLGKNPETVRRWIRDGKLEAHLPSKKQGHVITEQMLDTFLANSPQYTKNINTLIKNPVGTIAVASTMIGSFLTKQYLQNDRIKNAEVSTEEIRKLIAEDISERKAVISRKKKTIASLQKEVDEERARIVELELLDREMIGLDENTIVKYEDNRRNREEKL